ncbi:hypothetical protein BDI4_630139 [Burkholderia diffusa]|nr:hypothetical protein BDI4_630139 [Burkholderia diffusa]
MVASRRQCWKTFSKFRHRLLRCQCAFTPDATVKTRMVKAGGAMKVGYACGNFRDL